MFALFLVLSLESIYAIDIGSQNVRVAVSTPGKAIEIKTNERDQRMTPNYLAFPLSDSDANLKSVEWIVGPDAERIWMRNQSRGIHNPIGKLWNPTEHEFNGLGPVYTAATALYHQLKGLKMKTDKITLLVPVYAAPQYRQLLLLTTKLICKGRIILR